MSETQYIMFQKELIIESKQQTKAWKRAFIIITAILFLTNAVWLFAYIGKDNHHVINTDSVTTNMVISNYVEFELQYFRDSCNFTDLELMVFNYRAKGKTLEEIAEDLDYSTEQIKRISAKINRKILKVI